MDEKIKRRKIIKETRIKTRITTKKRRTKTTGTIGIKTKTRKVKAVERAVVITGKKEKRGRGESIVAAEEGATKA